MHPPSGFSVPRGSVCCLRRALYGLKQAPHAWFERFTSAFQAIGFSVSAHDAVLFPRGRTLLLYVDGMLIAGDDSQHIAPVKKRCSKTFMMSDLVPSDTFSGLRSLLRLMASTCPSRNTSMTL